MGANWFRELVAIKTGFIDNFLNVLLICYQSK